jgi:hypothetical protein
MDFDSHMRNTAFLDRAADVRVTFFTEHGFPAQAFAERRLAVPPADLLAAMRLLPRTDDFEEPRSSLKNGG